MMGTLPSLLQAEPDGRGQEESAALKEAPRCGGISVYSPRAANKSCIQRWSQCEGDTA